MIKLSEWAHLAALMLHAALIVGLLLWCGWPAGALLVLPLLAPVPGLLRRRTYTAGWASMLVVFYVGGLLAEGVAMPQRHFVSAVLSVIAALDFVSLGLFVRLSGREALAARKESSGAAAR